jgi:hypothetical protein
MAKFRLQRLKGGRKHVLHTDCAADYLRCLIDEMAAGFDVLCHVTVTEGDGTDWMSVRVDSAPEAPLLDRASEFRFGEFADELHHVFGSFYDREGGADTAPLSRAWLVRHRRGFPWI